MKLRSRSRHIDPWNGKRTSTAKRWSRRPRMPQFDSLLPAEFAADAVVERSRCFVLVKQINRLQRKQMTPEVIKQLCG